MVIYNKNFNNFYYVFSLDPGENDKYNISSEDDRKSSKTRRGSNLDLEPVNFCQKV
jgi:hypothetical protein